MESNQNGQVKMKKSNTFDKMPVESFKELEHRFGNSKKQVTTTDIEILVSMQAACG